MLLPILHLLKLLIVFYYLWDKVNTPSHDLQGTARSGLCLPLWPQLIPPRPLAPGLTSSEHPASSVLRSFTQPGSADGGGGSHDLGSISLDSPHLSLESFFVLSAHGTSLLHSTYHACHYNPG